MTSFYFYAQQYPLFMYYFLLSYLRLFSLTDMALESTIPPSIFVRIVSGSGQAGPTHRSVPSVIQRSVRYNGTITGPYQRNRHIHMYGTRRTYVYENASSVKHRKIQVRLVLQIPNCRIKQIFDTSVTLTYYCYYTYACQSYHFEDSKTTSIN